MRAVSSYSVRMLSPVTVGEFVLTRAERDQLRAWSAGGASRLAVRARIVLACSEPRSGVRAAGRRARGERDDGAQRPPPVLRVADGGVGGSASLGAAEGWIVVVGG